MKIPAKYRNVFLYYFGENECPFEEGSYEASFWHGEKAACEADYNKRQTNNEIFNSVCQYVLNAIDSQIQNSPKSAFEEYLNQQHKGAIDAISSSFESWLNPPSSLPVLYLLLREN